MNATARSILFCALVSLIAACGSSPPVRFFSLSPTVAPVSQDTDDAVTLGLGPVRMPSYIDRSQIVTRGAGLEVEVDELSRWAEPLGPAFHRIVATDIDNAVEGLVVMAFPWEQAVNAEVDYRLLGDIIRFDVDRSGLAILEVQWGIAEVATGEVLVHAQRSRYEAHAGSSSDPAAVASAMNEAMAGFSREIARVMESTVLK